MSVPGTCDICGEKQDDVLLHLSILHPDVVEDFETWPDGSVVVIDSTLEPEDFA
jgi:hypothetical protein